MGVQSFLPFSPRQLPTRAWKKTADSGNDSRVKALISKWPWPVETHHCTDSLAAAGHASTCAGLVNCLFLYSFITLHFSNFPAHQKKTKQNNQRQEKNPDLYFLPQFQGILVYLKNNNRVILKNQAKACGGDNGDRGNQGIPQSTSTLGHVSGLHGQVLVEWGYRGGFWEKLLGASLMYDRASASWLQNRPTTGHS